MGTDFVMDRPTFAYGLRDCDLTKISIFVTSYLFFYTICGNLSNGKSDEYRILTRGIQGFGSE